MPLSRSTRYSGPFWRLSGYARRDLDVSVCCGECYAKWAAGVWFWRWCRACKRVHGMGAEASGWQS